jgi:SHS2 domain-containing protein
MKIDSHSRGERRPVDHVGEEEITVSSPTLEGVFAELARSIARECGVVADGPGEWKHVSVSSRDTEALLVDFCNEMIAMCEVDRVAYDETRNIRVQKAALELDVRGSKVTTWLSPLKAATFHGLSLSRDDNSWQCTILFDV